MNKILLNIFTFFLTVAFFPFVLLNKELHLKYLASTMKYGKFVYYVRSRFSIKHYLLKAVSITAITVFLLPLWLVGYVCTAIVLYMFLYFLGIVSQATPVAGNSMLPTIKDGETVQTYGYSSLTSQLMSIKRGDIVIIASDKTTTENGEKVDYIKRVIGLPGDKVQIKDGFVYLNGELLNEPYILKPRSTYGGEAIKECETIEIPQNKVFILGDNRKRSGDSRKIGLLEKSDIKSVLPFDKQLEYRNHWRDSSKDKDQVGLASFDASAYYESLNKLRIEKGLKPLKQNNKLEEAAKIRATTIIDYDERNTPPEKSHLTPSKAYQQTGYYNIITGEVNTLGYYDADELANYWLEFNTKDKVLNADYQETGIAAVVGRINGCETQIIVQEFGGYMPPNYSQKDIDSWKESLTGLKNIQPGWGKLKENTSYYEQNKADIDRINNLIALRISHIEAIISRMEANQWFTSQERGFIDQNNSLYDEVEVLAKKLNSR